jgi:hypothetical protein
MSDCYDSPCEICGRGIPRTGKRGRPPKVHASCKGATPKPQNNSKTQEQETPAATLPEYLENCDPPDTELQAVNEFLKEKPSKSRGAMVDYREDRLAIMARDLRKGDNLYMRRLFDYVKLTKVVDCPNSHEHVLVSWKGDSIRVYKHGMCYIEPRG